MDPIVAAIQKAALQQQMCNATGMMGMPLTMPLSMQIPMQMPMPFVNGPHPMNYSGPIFDVFGGQKTEGSQFQPHNGLEVADEEDEDDDEQARTLFCNNLDERVTEEILYEVFLQAGPIESARIPQDNMGRQRNFGFVTYQHRCAVPFAVELYQGLELFQKKVTIRQQNTDNVKSSRNPFLHEHMPPMLPMIDHVGPRLNRRSMHEGKQYNRGSGFQNQHNNNDLRRRSDSVVMDSKRPRPHHQQHHNSSGGNRRSDQRHIHGKRRLL